VAGDCIVMPHVPQGTLKKHHLNEGNSGRFKETKRAEARASARTLFSMAVNNLN
jgi:hypothetical protein